jgi:protein CpxP
MTLRKKILSGAGVFIFAGLLAATAAFAYPGFGRPAMTQRMGPPLWSQLQLSDAQRAQIKEIFAGSRDTIRPLAQQLREKQAALRESTAGGTFDEASVRAQAQDIAAVQAQLIVARTHIRTQLLGVLSDEQKTRLSELRAERIQQFRERRQQHSAPPEQS